MSRAAVRAALGAAALCAGTTAVGRAQTDYRNLDDDRPVRVEDAYPLERYAFELVAPYRLERSKAGTTVHAVVPELTAGILRNGMIGAKVPLAGVGSGGATSRGLAGIHLFALYNFNTESPSLPAVSVRADWAVPAGSLGGRSARGGFTVIATRSFGASRLHVNAARGFGGRAGTGPAVEPLPRWWYGAALDRTLFRQSTLLIAEVHAQRDEDGLPVEVDASLGVRWQWTPTLVLDAGITRGLRTGLGPDYGLSIGLSHAFGIAGLMPRGRAGIPAAAGGDHEHH